MNRGAATALRCVAAIVSAACASPPEVYHPTEDYYARQQIVWDDGSQIEVGRPFWPIDKLNHWLLSLPTKLLLLDWRLHDHEFPQESGDLLVDYLRLNRLTAVKVRHNQYAPIGELKRLVRNHEVGAGYRATLGVVLWLQYALFPHRLFGGVPLPIVGGGDHFNPFSNTINVFSSDPAVLLHEAGHAKDYVRHEAKGTSFALLRLLPGVDLLQEANASTDAIRYLHCRGFFEIERRAHKTLIPAYSTYIAGYLPGGLVVTLPVVGAGHVSGRLQARQRGLEIERERDLDLRKTRRGLEPPICFAAFPLETEYDPLRSGGGEVDGEGWR
jgi:hypothetical protein